MSPGEPRVEVGILIRQAIGIWDQITLCVHVLGGSFAAMLVPGHTLLCTEAWWAASLASSSHEIKRRLLLGEKVVMNLNSI